MDRRVVFFVAALAAFFFLAEAQAFAQDDPDVFVSAGPSSEILLGSGGVDLDLFFTAKGGFKPEEIALAGDGKLYICDSSSSQIFRLDPASQSPELVTIYDRSSAVSPNDPEQPKGCTIAGNDLLFLSRNGRGGNAKTGLWAIKNVVAPVSGQPALLLGLDSVGGISGESLAVNFDGRVFFTFGNEVWVATPRPNSGRIDDESDFRMWAPTAAEGFGIATKGVPDAFGALQTQVFVAAKFSGMIEVLQETIRTVEDPPGIFTTVREGTKVGCTDIDVPNMPNALEFDGSGDLWLTTSEQSSGRRGAVYEIDAPVCAIPPSPPGLPPAPPVLRDGDLSAAVGIALTPTGSEPVTLVFPPNSEKSNTANLCNSTFNLDQVASLCQNTWTVSCRLMPQAEFAARTPMFPLVGQDFSATECADFPGASGNCTEIRITQSTTVSQCTEDDILKILANWQFYSLSSFDHPGLLYSPGDFDPLPKDNPFIENILVDYDPVPVPTDPLDPRATGSREAWGSGIVVVDNAPNRPPTAVLTVTPAVAQCSETVTLNGMASFDNDWNVTREDSITRFEFGIDDPTLQDPVQDGPLWEYPASSLASGSYTAYLRVYDEGWQSVPPSPLPSAIVDVPFTVAEAAPPSFSTVPYFSQAGPQATIESGSFATMWPPNHEMVPFLIEYAVDAGGCAFQCEIVIESDEPENGTGDGDIAPDFEITGEKTFNLRSERAQNQSGRTYFVTVKCTDTAGNVTESSPITVFVPSNQ